MTERQKKIAKIEQEIMERLSDFLRRFRSGREKNEFWVSFKLTPSKMGRFENMKERPSLFRLIEICERLNLSANWLLLGEGPETLEPQLTETEIIARTCDGIEKLLAAQKPLPRKEILDLIRSYANDPSHKDGHRGSKIVQIRTTDESAPTADS